MSDTQYAVAGGIIQFDVEEKDTSAGPLREATIKSFTSQKLIRITLWDSDWAGVDVNKGDTLFVDGKYEVSLGQARDGSEREYIQITAKTLTVLPSAERNDSRPAAGQSSSDEPRF